MLPPIIRTGPIPVEERVRGAAFVVLTAQGWTLAGWHPGGYLVSLDRRAGSRAIGYSEVLCWLPEDGS